MTSTAIYRSLMMEFERRRLELGYSMATVDDLAGTQDGFYAKMIYPDTPSGRQSRWETVQLVAEALFGRDCLLQITHDKAAVLRAGSIDKGASTNALQNRHWRHTRHFKDLSVKGNIARQIRLKPRKRTAIARKAAKTRWKRIREAKRKGEAHKAVNARKVEGEPLSK